MASIPMDIEGDAFGKIYEYFLGRAPIGSNSAHQRLALIVGWLVQTHLMLPQSLAYHI